MRDFKENLFEAARLDYYGKRGPLKYVKVELEGNNIIFTSEPIT